MRTEPCYPNYWYCCCCYLCYRSSRLTAHAYLLHIQNSLTRLCFRCGANVTVRV